MKYSQKVLTAFKRTIRAYEKLIADPEKEKSKWEKYGGGSACRLCRVVDGNSAHGCYGCVFLKLDDEDTSCVHETMDKLLKALRKNTGIKRAATARLKWIKRKAARNGVEV